MWANILGDADSNIDDPVALLSTPIPDDLDSSDAPPRPLSFSAPNNRDFAEMMRLASIVETLGGPAGKRDVDDSDDDDVERENWHHRVYVQSEALGREDVVAGVTWRRGEDSSPRRQNADKSRRDIYDHSAEALGPHILVFEWTPPEGGFEGENLPANQNWDRRDVGRRMRRGWRVAA